ncbi:MAG: peptidase M16 domain-containing protein [Parcubacteria group bacterium Gr01-1014_48]|nr:MAG: peptidase M16 domain-containing protein [Parcubacteria group bacterium Greene0416_14]TSC73273.1 MAG: peptidase M16 domain-containing protein [Parcubacteria group bacterium Gr01-1014_48]TSD01657.1 MAG: peptidase M16 domain-containing protein [Parcubacteria group bacterium Greene1014_15]TSD07752.1 MAG: peptidase M16 domain-containing protein [Parcubacteria group bacterium Greene0714_4]
MKRHTTLSKRLTEYHPMDGMRLITVPTNLEDAIIIHGSIPGGEMWSPKENPCISMMTMEMLDEGTASLSKKELREKLESIGASIEFNIDTHRVSFSIRCLKKNCAEVIDLLARELREPSFPSKDLEIVKTRLASQIDEEMENTKFRAETRFLQLLYPKNHPNYHYDGAALKKFISKTKRQDLIDFHKRIYYQRDIIITAAGDIDADALNNLFKTAFTFCTENKLPQQEQNERALATTARTEIISIKDKASADIFIGAPIGMTKTHRDYYPLTLGFSILGGTFFARLMNNVREKKGLTYRTRAGVAGADHGLDGYWYAFAMFAPNLLKKGEEAVRFEIEDIIKHGVTAEEVRTHKETVDGSYKVALASAQGISAVLLDNAEQGRPHAFLDTYVDMINSITLDQVNTALQKYVRLDTLVTVIAGSIDKDKNPL